MKRKKGKNKTKKKIKKRQKIEKIMAKVKPRSNKNKSQNVTKKHTSTKLSPTWQQTFNNIAKMHLLKPSWVVHSGMQAWLKQF